MSHPVVKAFFDEATFAVSYVVSDPSSRRAAIVDPVLDYDPASGRTATKSADEVVAYVLNSDLTLDWILETHVHADHLSAAPTCRRNLADKQLLVPASRWCRTRSRASSTLSEQE